MAERIVFAQKYQQSENVYGQPSKNLLEQSHQYQASQAAWGIMSCRALSLKMPVVRVFSRAYQTAVETAGASAKSGAQFGSGTDHLASAVTNADESMEGDDSIVSGSEAGTRRAASTRIGP